MRPNAAAPILALALMLISSMAPAQSYPSKPVRFIVGYAAGGVADTSARIMAQRMSVKLGETVIVENRVGAGGRIGAEMIAKAPADGYQLLYTTNGTHSFAPVSEKVLPYDPIRDFTSIALVGTYGFLMVVHPSVPAKTVAEFIDYAKKNSGKLNYGSSGAGSGVHFAGELFKMMAGVNMTHVPYKGAAPALQDTIAGVCQLTFDAGAGQAVEGGKVRLLGTTGSQRDPRFPNSPTLAEAGVPGYDLISWVGIFAPPGLAPGIATQLNAAANEALMDPGVRQRLGLWGVIPTPGTPAALEQLVRTEISRLRKIATDGKLQFD